MLYMNFKVLLGLKGTGRGEREGGGGGGEEER